LYVQDLDVVVQPGISWEDLNEFLLPYHLYFAPDPGPGASIGGMCGTSCSGTRAWKHGTMRENVIALRVVLPDGRVIQTRRRPSKSSAGYNLTGLLLGSEGTLGVITEITLKLKITPEKTSVAMIGFNHIDDAAKLVSDVVRSGVPCNRMEMMDDVAIQSYVFLKLMANFENSVNNSAGMEHPVLPTLLVEFAGSPAAIHDQALVLGSMAKKHGAAYYKAAADEDEAENLWEVRKTALFAAFTLREDKCEMVITDVAVPVSRLSDMLLATKSLLKKYDLTASIVSHAGDGNFHCFLLVNREVDGEMHRAHEFQEALVDAALDMDGTCTGEHGVGKGKMGKLVKELGPDAIDVMRSVRFWSKGS
jgi:D-lactate dehydrogenase (cytochrome)